MSGLIKELLLDYALNRLNVDLRSDLTVSIQNVFSSSVFTKVDVRILNLYLSGYTSKEIASMFIVRTVTEIEETLERIFTAIEAQSGYTDQIFLNKIELTKKYRKHGIDKLGIFLVEHSKHYGKHDIE